MPIDEEWLEQVKEEILEPDIPIIDPHHHLWDRSPVFHNPPLRYDRYMANDLERDLSSGHKIISTVYVECGSMYREEGPDYLRPVGETEFVNTVAEDYENQNTGKPTRICEGIVGHANLSLGKDVDEVLEAHLAAAPDRMRGIRHSVSWDPSEDIRNASSSPAPGLLSDEKFRTGVRRLAVYGLSFEAWLYHPQISELTELAKACPEVTIVFDHFGGPLGIGPYKERRSEIYRQWNADVTELAECPNVFAKLGGLNMAINGFSWHKRLSPPTSEELAANRHYYLHTIEKFSPERCMFESNFPVDKVSCSYPVLWNSFKRMVGHLTRKQRASLFHETATRVYRLKTAV